LNSSALATRTREPSGASFDVGEPSAGVVAIRVRGAVDGGCAASARQAMTAALASAPRVVVVDLTTATGINAAGAVLLAAMARHACRFGAQLRVDKPA
jgi:anti-anti-sigma regulatory factor